MIPSFSVIETTQFFKDLLGFSSTIETEDYAILQKDNLTIHILPAGEDIGQMEFYLEVDNVDKIWSYIRDKIKELKFREPFDRDYGMRELHIEVPKTKTLLFIGQSNES